MAVERTDILVIGSGFGGAVSSARLVDAGAQVTLLERGPWRDTQAVRHAAIARPAPLPANGSFASHLLHRFAVGGWLGKGLRLHRNGLFDIHYDRQLSIVCSNGVGGGSHVYSAMNVPPADGYWQGHHEQIDDATLATHYRWILDTMGSRPLSADDQVPNHLLNDTQRPPWMRVEGIAQPALGLKLDSDRRYANNSFFGSADNTKITLDTLLLSRLEHGLMVHANHEVLDLTRRRNDFRLTVIDHDSGRLKVWLASKVVLAAGTLNTLRLLLDNRARGNLRGMPALGQGIGGNGDVAGYWPCNLAGQDFSIGAPCHGRFSLPESQVDLTRYGFNGIDQIPLPQSLRARLKRDLILVGMGADAGDGSASWSSRGLRLHYRQQHSPVLADIYTDFQRIGSLSGTPVRFLRHRPMTVHPYGGARLGRKSSEGVINHRGEVHDIPGLLIADGSALPAAPGVPPSMTIAAWAGHVASQLLQS